VNTVKETPPIKDILYKDFTPSYSELKAKGNAPPGFTEAPYDYRIPGANVSNRLAIQQLLSNPPLQLSDEEPFNLRNRCERSFLNININLSRSEMCCCRKWIPPCHS
jgi:hypothetical protein